MMNYLIHSSILLAGLVIFYWLLLRKETFFSLNRWTLIFSMVLCLLLPLITMPSSLSLRGGENKVASIIEKISSPQNDVQDQTAPTESTAVLENEAATTDGNIVAPIKQWSLGQILFAVYLLGVVIFAFIFLLQVIILMTRKYNLNSVKTGKYTIVELVKEEEPYSFMNTIFINPAIYDPETYEQIIAHEKLHVDQAHFIDKLLAELILVVFWFNPFAWVLRSTIGKNLEFLTDQTLLKNGIEKESYQLSLLKVSVSTKPFNLTTSYNNSFLKNRILMMNSKNSSVASTWKYLFILPLFFLSLISLNAVDQNDSNSTTQWEQTTLPAEQLATKDTKDKNKQKAKTPKSKDKSAKKANPKVNVKPQVNSNIQPQVNVPDLSDKINEAIDTKTAKTYGSGINYTKELRLDNFDRLLLSIPGNLNVKQGKDQQVKIEGPADIVDEILTEVYNGEWNIRVRDKHKKFHTQVNIDVTVRDLKSIGINGTGNINSVGTFDLSGDLTVACSGVGNINFASKAKNVMCAISGHGNINLKGAASNVTIAISGSGNVMTEYMKVRDAKVTISGSGSSSVNASDNLAVTISGSGNVNYRGNPKLKTKYSGSGRARKSY